MSVVSGLRYEVVEGWEQLPSGYEHRDVSGVAVGLDDQVYVLTRMQPRVIVYEADGRFVRSFGEKVFTDRTHGVTVGPDGAVYIVDDGDHTLRKFTPDGTLVMTLGTRGVPSNTGYVHSDAPMHERLSTIRGGPPFNKPTNVAVAPNGDLYVADGYGNARVHQFSPDGRLVRSWGEPGTGPGQFHLPHGVAVTADGRVLVADRENDRLQVFSAIGEYLEEWADVQRPTDVCVDGDGRVYVSELAWRTAQVSMRHGPVAADLAGRVSVFDRDGTLIARWGGPDGCAPGNFWAPHAIAIDSQGALYIGEVVYSFSGLGQAGLVPAGCHTLQKFVRRYQ